MCQAQALAQTLAQALAQTQAQAQAQTQAQTQGRIESLSLDLVPLLTTRTVMAVALLVPVGVARRKTIVVELLVLVLVLVRILFVSLFRIT